ncbi:hypothetical protein WJX81_001994 [Elliptochloris bilobata]|uniref:RRM domain-containing protein n=1 Tax=Elliptochloris bilobata TaxID=381761 RepID=A0AAW1RE21_9CHLO
MPQQPAADAGFAALHVTLRQGADTRSKHLFIRPHHGAGQADAAGSQKAVASLSERALFVVGLPFLHSDHQGVVSRLFGAFGSVERVAVHAEQTSAIVVFAKVAARDKALKAAAKGRSLELELPLPDKPYGLKAWVEAHKALFPGNAVLRQQLDEWTEAHEAEEERRKAAAAEAANCDGWTVVTRKAGRRKTTDGSGIAVGSVAPAVARAQADARKDQKLADFYRFQQRDRRRNDLSELRQKFAEDKRRIAELKAARRFKPY